jgi:hypothetical protein
MAAAVASISERRVFRIFISYASDDLEMATAHSSANTAFRNLQVHPARVEMR